MHHKRLPLRLAELIRLEALIATLPAPAKATALARFPVGSSADINSYPSYLIELAEFDAKKPTLLLTGGVHGLERIGSAVVIAFLESLLQRLEWDHGLQHQLSQLNMLFLPMVNPVGMAAHTRSNGNGVDLMRNAPVACEEKAAFLVGGQQYSAKLPWFRGNPSEPEAETQMLFALVRDKLFQSPFSMVLDCHSGFGQVDRLWFPYAKSRKPLPHLA
ncbi:MAG: DUF2817 domain-containing protein [Gammaproteobacteria bacterium]|nr:DUF2817 domain-containing protein [Gammaproteobacteria bacterium]